MNIKLNKSTSSKFFIKLTSPSLTPALREGDTDKDASAMMNLTRKRIKRGTDMKINKEIFCVGHSEPAGGRTFRPARILNESTS
ncbi:MAG: hypothetical protein ACI4N3_02485 [Alphaproteobacteria bacterium]